jgi:hypothetical protein
MDKLRFPEQLFICRNPALQQDANGYIRVQIKLFLSEMVQLTLI